MLWYAILIICFVFILVLILIACLCRPFSDPVLSADQVMNVDIEHDKLGMYNMSLERYNNGFRGFIRGNTFCFAKTLLKLPSTSYVFYMELDNILGYEKA